MEVPRWNNIKMILKFGGGKDCERTIERDHGGCAVYGCACESIPRGRRDIGVERPFSGRIDYGGVGVVDSLWHPREDSLAERDYAERTKTVREDSELEGSGRWERI